MAKLSAAGGLVWAVVLMFVVLGAEQSEGLLFDLGDLLAPWFSDTGSRPSPVRIFCHRNTTLNVAIRDNAVVLATINSSDRKQLWYQLYSRSSSYGDAGSAKSFSLVNAETSQVVVIPSGSAEKLHLTKKFDQDKAREELWTSGTPLTDGFFEVKVTKNPSLTLNALTGNVHDGTFVGIFQSEPSSDNTLWNFTKDYKASCAF